MRSKILLSLLVITLLTACGNKGSLYLPDGSPDKARQDKQKNS
ncbi:MAG: LPS translocon maturation chaperone LptM [Burkholderiales bacterium]